MINPFESNIPETNTTPTPPPFNPKDTGEIPDLPSFNINSGGSTSNFEEPPITINDTPFTQPVPFVQQTPFAQQPTTNYQTPNQSEKRKFVIGDLYWLRNLKPMYNSQLSPNETNLLIISYNADFENLRICFTNSSDITGKSMAIPMGARQNAVNIFSETCRELLAFFEGLSAQGQGSAQFPFSLMNCERMMSINSNWSPNETVIKVINHQMIEISTKQPNGTQHCFTMVLWQVKAFLECCKFMTNGNSWMMKIHSSINKD
jgi:hypothetical protein